MGAITEILDRTLAGIHATDDDVRAWVAIDEELAYSDARMIEARLERGEDLPLAGLTVGIKDIIDVAGLPTVAGFTPFEGRLVNRDAPLVARLREAGALIVGKTVTTQFAASDPSKTRNPWNLERTPGGSSAGSAAAVGAWQVDVALGTQTGGSVLRPSAFCGVTGFKPGYGWTSMEGVIPYAVSLDTLGIHARSVRHAARVYDVLARPGLPRCGGCAAIGPPRIGVWADALAHASEAMRAAVIDAVEHLAKEGAIVTDAIAPYSFDNLVAMHAIIIRAEGAAAHSQLHQRHAEHYAPNVRATIEIGMALPADAYIRAQRLRDHARAATVNAWSRFDVIAIPTSDDAAPGLETTGNPALQAVITMLGLPAITLPIGFNADYLPLGIQLVGTHPGADVHLLRVARWAETHLPQMPRPPHGVQEP